jgi:hypothetical protein
MIRVYWYLMVSVVDLNGIRLSDAEIQVYSSDGSLVASQTTSKDGCVQFELLSLEISKHGETIHGDYTLKVVYSQNTIQENINLNSSMQKTITIQK